MSACYFMGGAFFSWGVIGMTAGDPRYLWLITPSLLITGVGILLDTEKKD